MKEKVLGFWDSIKALWGKLSRKARIVLLGSVAGILALCLILTAALNQKTYVLLYNDLSTTEYAKVLNVLNDQGFDYQLTASGAILVSDKEINRARMQVATQGVTGVSFDENYSPGLTSTQSDKNYIQKNELQKRLQNIIETFEEVKQAAVTITLPESGTFALQSDTIPASANIMIIKRAGATLTPEQVQGIINIVKDGVPGLEEENISITDESGDMKSVLEQGITANNSKLRLTEEVNASARRQILSVLQPVFGSDSVEVAVSSELDTDAVVRETHTYNPMDPENPERNPLSNGEHEREMLGAAPGVAEGVPGANDNVGVPQYGEEYGTLGDNNSYRVYDNYNYLVGDTKEQIVKEGLTITNMTASVVIDATALPDGQRDQIIALAANAAGIPVANVTVANFEFARPPEPPVIDITQLTPTQILLIAGGVLLLLIIIITVIIIVMNRKRKREEEEAAAAEMEALQYDENGVPLLDVLDGEEDFEAIPIVETNEQKLKAQIKDLADSDPEIVAQLLKTWLSSV